MLSTSRSLLTWLAVLWFGVSALQADIPLQQNDHVILYGNSMVERLLEQGELQALIHLAQPSTPVHFRSFAWTGDEVGHRLRAEGYADHMKSLMALWPAKVVVVGFGMNESFQGPAGLPEFHQQLKVYLDQIARLHPGARVVLLSPTACEPGHSGPDPAARNRDLQAYSRALAEIAAERGAIHVDLLTASLAAYASSNERLTSNGQHLNATGNRAMARVIARTFVGESALARVDPNHLREVSLAASQLARYVDEAVRPKNGILYYGQRKRAEERDAEFPLYLRRIERADDLVQQLVANPKARFSDAPFIALAPPPVPPSGGSTHSVGIVKSPAEMQSEFQVAEGYSLNLFASEEQFPELRAPVQIAFDARGRLWVVTMPSFPHTLPGQLPEDKIVVLEDTDRDGRADTLKTFAGGFDALDGVAFAPGGLLVSEQSRHWFLQDTDGDGRADARREALRGLDLTDSHHGGMMATDPTGGVWFSDGVFHRSQFETPHGPVRGIDATTYRLNPRTGQIEPEWQSITPNPWKVTFDRTGNVFQMYGDGLVLDGLVLTWTPLGIYHPFAHARVLGYGKGSAAASISSPNFPEAYQQGMASAACVGPYVVSITRLDLDHGMARGSSRLDLMSSTNAAFRPVDVEFGFDGALYVSDFSSAIIGHAQHPMRDTRWNHTKGRIWRLTHNARPIVKDWPRIEGAPIEALLDLLTHSQDIVRKHARIELCQRGDRIVKPLESWVSKHLNEPQSLLESLFVLEGLGLTQPQLLESLFRSQSPLHRAAAVRLMRYQADRIRDVSHRLHTLASDPHPRVLMEVVDAVAHLRRRMPEVEHALHALHTDHPDVLRMVSDLRQGTKPAKGRSVPVLELSAETRLRHWQWMGTNGQAGPVVLDVQADAPKPPGSGIYRTFIHAGRPQPATLSVKHSFLDISVNGTQLLSHDSQWSSEQQVQFELNLGVNVIEIEFRQLRGRLPAVHVFDPLGQPLAQARLAKDGDSLTQLATEWRKAEAALGDVVKVKAAPGLQFVPRTLRVKAGSKVHLVFENPDLMVHNFVLIAPGSADEVGALVDRIATDPNGMAKGYLPSTPKILHATPLVNPKGKADLHFTAPSTPGRYPFLCTFPGHWRMMRGELVVE